jgi:hypothetical protein
MARSETAGRGVASLRPAAPVALAALSVVAAGLAAVFLVVGRPLAGAGGAAVAAGALVLSGVRAREGAAPRALFADAVAERVTEAVILGAIAWVHVGRELLPTAAALAALVLSYLASYLRAKATGLGFPVSESLLLRPLRLGLMVTGLFVPAALPVLLWLVAAAALQSVIREAAAVGRMREEPG